MPSVAEALAGTERYQLWPERALKAAATGLNKGIDTAVNFVGNAPENIAKAIWGGVTLPRDVYQGRVDPLSQEGIGRATDLAGTVMGGTFGLAPRGAVGSGPVRGIRAYHGSPYDFDRFDMSKIGTGEGAQAYGHGLYFAEAEPVARQYRDNLARPNFNETKSGVPISSDLSRILEDAYNDAMNIHGVRSPSGNDAVFLAQKKLERQRADALKAGDFDWYSKVADQQAELARMGRDAPKHGGRMYEVNINARPEQFLDWDRPLAAQHPQVRQAMESAGYSSPQVELPAQFSTIGYTAKKELQNPSEIMRLNEAGIPGIRYLDQGSRAAGEGSRNYVLFRDDIIDILRKYGVAGALALGAGATANKAEAGQ